MATPTNAAAEIRRHRIGRIVGPGGLIALGFLFVLLQMASVGPKLLSYLPSVFEDRSSSSPEHHSAIGASTTSSSLQAKVEPSHPQESSAVKSNSNNSSSSNYKGPNGKHSPSQHLVVVEKEIKPQLPLVEDDTKQEQTSFQIDKRKQRLPSQVIKKDNKSVVEQNREEGINNKSSTGEQQAHDSNNNPASMHEKIKEEHPSAFRVSNKDSQSLAEQKKEEEDVSQLQADDKNNNKEYVNGRSSGGERQAEDTSNEGNQKPAHHKPLNVIVLYPDDMRHDSLGVAGTQIVKTPFLDRLAGEGIRFTQNAVTTSICWISRATLFSGQYVSRHGAEFLFRPIRREAWNHTYPALLRQAGYYTGHVGKWQFRNAKDVQRYFDYVRLAEGYHVYKGSGKIKHITDKNQNDALQFLRTRPKDRNFALQVAFYAPKAVGNSDMQWTPKASSAQLYNDTPTLQYPTGMNESYSRLPPFLRTQSGRFAPRARWRERFGTPTKFDASMKAYYRMISELDIACEKIYKELETQGILNETMVIFTTDNGFFHSEHGLSGKWFPYQESIRVPLIIRDPRMPANKIGTTNDEFTLNIDLASTILGAAGLDSHPSMQGRDIADLYLPRDKNPAPWRQEFYYEFPGRGKNTIPQANALVHHDFKLFHYPEWKTEQLFNIKEDPLEEFDIINKAEHAQLVKEMRKRYYELQAQAK